MALFLLTFLGLEILKASGKSVGVHLESVCGSGGAGHTCPPVCKPGLCRYRAEGAEACPWAWRLPGPRKAVGSSPCRGSFTSERVPCRYQGTGQSWSSPPFLSVLSGHPWQGTSTPGQQVRRRAKEDSETLSPMSGAAHGVFPSLVLTLGCMPRHSCL